ncbi:ABC transporter permease [Verrucomicrobium spinosum]|uniref:ABC transporter permease n=1 Tax=Verrucomicrobium spinosum TaxID=2736 RepID=UPI00017462F6|nr:ABC transporter permease [Verrucomicrobium spinosum]
MPPDPKTILVIEAGRTEAHYWRDLWRYRELFAFLAWRDILVRYKQTVIGIAWALLRPLLTMLIFTVIFGKVAKLDSGPLPYAILVGAAMLPWQFFANALTESSQSLVSNSNLISKVYFPRLILPASAVVVSLVDFVISFAILAGLMVWYQHIPGWQVFALPAFVVLAILAALGPGLLITALNVKYRDFRYIIPFIVQFGLFISPVGFRTSLIPEQWRLLYSLNPMVGVIDGFRWCFGDESGLSTTGFFCSLATSGLLLIVGVRYFRRMERRFADII